MFECVRELVFSVVCESAGLVCGCEKLSEFECECVRVWAFV